MMFPFRNLETDHVIPHANGRGTQAELLAKVREHCQQGA